VTQELIAPALAGLGLGASLIIAIGAQNAFVLRHGITRSHVTAIVVTCVVCDWALIAAGGAGFGSLVSAFPAVTSVAAWGGAAFLAVYGAMSFRAALHPGALEGDGRRSGGSLASTGAAVAATLAVSLLNPHVYLDTVVLLGSVAAQYRGAARWAFVTGAGVGSLVWFSVLGYGARMLAPLFERERTWRILDVAIGVVMWWIAASLAWGQLVS
jgi:L-lysine exporter family protein LysE/ArgO